MGFKSVIYGSTSSISCAQQEEQGACREPLPRRIHKYRHHPVAQNLWGHPAELWSDLNSPQPLPRPWSGRVSQAQWGPAGALAPFLCHPCTARLSTHPRAACHAHATSCPHFPRPWAAPRQGTQSKQCPGEVAPCAGSRSLRGASAPASSAGDSSGTQQWHGEPAHSRTVQSRGFMNKAALLAQQEQPRYLCSHLETLCTHTAPTSNTKKFPVSTLQGYFSKINTSGLSL